MAVVGIDLGTTYSAIAMLNQMGKPEIKPNSEGNNFTPSVVFFESKNNIVVGENAKNTAELYPERVVQFVKNYMGAPDEETGQEKSWEMFGQGYRPEEISAMILRKVVQDAAASLDAPITDAVITVPAIFGEAQRHATKMAAQTAGLNVISLLDEPVAAALHYGLSKADGLTEPQNILVCDLGGGTFDVTVMRVSENDITVLHTGGDRRLGGKLWDDSLIEHVVSCFRNEHNLDPWESPETIQSLRAAAEGAKRQLTQREKAMITCHYEGQSTRVEITRTQFETLTAAHLERTERCVEFVMRRLIEQKDLRGWSDIHEVLLVGGASKMPQVLQMVQRLSGKEPKLFEPDLAVAKGAALFSVMELLRVARRTGDNSKLKSSHIDPDAYIHLAATTVTTVTSFALGEKLLKDIPAPGVESKPEDYINVVRIKPNTKLPVKVTGDSYTTVDGQRNVPITILEGEDPDWRHCQVVGSGNITGIPEGLPQGTRVEVTLELTDESLIQVTAVEKKFDTRCNFILKREMGMAEVAVAAARANLDGKTVE